MLVVVDVYEDAALGVLLVEIEHVFRSPSSGPARKREHTMCDDWVRLPKVVGVVFVCYHLEDEAAR